VISPDGKPANLEEEIYCIRDGIILIPKNTVIPAGSILFFKKKKKKRKSGTSHFESTRG